MVYFIVIKKAQKPNTDHRSLFQLLEKYRIAFVIADSGTKFPYHKTIATDFVYLRFHRHESLYASDYNETDLAGYAQKIKNWLEQGNEVWDFSITISRALPLKMQND